MASQRQHVVEAHGQARVGTGSAPFLTHHFNFEALFSQLLDAFPHPPARFEPSINGFLSKYMHSWAYGRADKQTSCSFRAALRIP